MKAPQTDLPVRDVENEEIKNMAEKIWNVVSRYFAAHVSIEKDGIFNDPDWPHLWDHQR